MATKKNTKVNDSVDNAINDSTAAAFADDVEDNDTLVEQESDDAAASCCCCHHQPPIIRVKRVENKDLEATLQEVGYRNVAQILVEPSLGSALFNIIYWESNDED